MEKPDAKPRRQASVRPVSLPRCSLLRTSGGSLSGVPTTLRTRPSDRCLSASAARAAPRQAAVREVRPVRQVDAAQRFARGPAGRRGRGAGPRGRVSRGSGGSTRVDSGFSGGGARYPEMKGCRVQALLDPGSIVPCGLLLRELATSVSRGNCETEFVHTKRLARRRVEGRLPGYCFGDPNRIGACTSHVNAVRVEMFE